VAALWKLPPDIQLVLGNHHNVVVDKLVHPLTAIVAVAEQLARFFNYGVMIGGANADPTDGAALAKARGALALDEGRMELLRTQAEKVMEGLKSSL
jgi:MoxR-like ATPase